MTIRIALAVLASSVALAACNGWPDASSSVEAANKPEKFQTYAPAAGEQVAMFAFADRRWLLEPAAIALPGVKLQPIGNAGTTSLYAPAGFEQPYDVLFARAGATRWRRAVPIE
ncbi:MAG: hypothetical protein ACT4O1_13250 [Gemmatimonadota bacterium]